MSDFEITRLFSLVDINGDKSINYDEFIAIFQENKWMNEDILIEFIFTQMDVKGLNHVGFDEIKYFFLNNGLEISETELKEI
mmetsp:Transcript_5387/g.11295  ORF Transcript_5387/g.11295 Transcript_5387/m.11295 type:complete len:82 (-) Transcript_5387:554-799(-)